MDFEEFRNLDLAEIGHWPLPAKLIVWGAMLFFVGYMSYQFLLKDQMTALSLAEREERTLKLQFENKYLMASRLASQQQKSEHPQASDTANNTVASLLEQISRAGANNGVEFLLFQPEPEIKTTDYTELPIRIRVAGDYHSFGHFISELAGLSQAFGLQELSISRSTRPGSRGGDAGTGPKADSRSGQNLLILELVAKRYRLQGQATQTTQGGR
ncbi:MAG: type 4a pilus biogenesis protein PilO [Gammaproteobacteria bacterium]|nr:type 4a pilus biogenesis protein PilO [Gammaproteobacteria bacterium]